MRLKCLIFLNCLLFKLLIFLYFYLLICFLGACPVAIHSPGGDYCLNFDEFLTTSQYHLGHLFESLL